MKRWIIGAIAALAVGFLGWLPFPCTDAGELYLVETLLLEADGRQVTLYAGNVTGQGESLEAALLDLEHRAPGQLFLRQTQRLIFCGGAAAELDPLLLPEELPLGTAVYGTEAPAEKLCADPDRLNAVLEAQERRRPDTPTLARLQNSALAREKIALAALPWEEAYETE